MHICIVVVLSWLKELIQLLNIVSCAVGQVWSLLMEETERLIDLMWTSADRLATTVLDAVTQIISEKKLVRKLYAEKRNCMDMELDRVCSI